MNPFLRVLKKYPRGSKFYGPKSIECPFHIREELVQKYSWAIPDAEAIKTIAKYGPIIEIGAGKGYWASQISRRSRVVAYDMHLKDNHYTDNGYMFFDVQPMNDISLEEIFNLHSVKTLFLCWPPYGTDMAYKTLMAYSGEFLIYVGESSGGCTGDDSFHNELNEKWEVVEEQSIPKFHGLHDYLTVYKRK